MPRNIRLTDDQKAAMRKLRRDNRDMTLREIGQRFGVTAACVCGIVNERPAEPQPTPPKAITPPFESFIRPIPLSRLMAGKAHPIRRTA